MAHPDDRYVKKKAFDLNKNEFEIACERRDTAAVYIKKDLNNNKIRGLFTVKYKKCPAGSGLNTLGYCQHT
jgi:hypothetical protein